ncbi:uncharacterized protein RHO25_002261 [Cercospora beticola]|uniref:DUF6590 domain-containing protein n=1 Tax=Cercospora beticola TaxID=122368 RepID=A0ABZ0NDR8_CERBT|nr:hypothetical protein RHO25_002261 [Cercospora beticola]
MDDLKARCESCRLSLTQVIVRVRNASPGSPLARTTENSWTSQRTRLKLWVADLLSLSAELEREQQSCVQAFDAAGISVLEIANGERLPYEEQQPVEPEEADQLSDEDDEEFYEIPERLQAIEDVIDRLFRASNAQFDRILLLQSANTRPQPERPEQHIRDKGKGKAAQKPQKRLTDASNLPAQTSLAIRPPPLETHFGRASSASADSRPEHVVPTPMPIAVAADIDKPPRLARVMEWRPRDIFTEETRGLDQQEATPSSSATNPPQQGRHFSFAGLPTEGGGGGPEMMVATREGTRPQYGQTGTSQPAARHSDFDYQISRPADGDLRVQGRLFEHSSRPSFGPYDTSPFWTASRNRPRRAYQEEEQRPASSYRRSSPVYQHLPGRVATTVRFQIHQRDFFRQHCVFALEPSCSIVDPAPVEPFDTIRNDDPRPRSVCRYVVIEEASPAADHFLALPILTYGGRGVAASDVVKGVHGIIYTSIIPPRPGVSEFPGRHEDPMVPNAIRIMPMDPEESLETRSRINYGRPTRIPLTTKIYHIGHVDRDHRDLLIRQYQHVQQRKQQEEMRRQDPAPQRQNEQEGPRTGESDRARAGAEATLYQAEFRKRKDEGQPVMAILQYLITVYQRLHPGVSWEQASQIIQSLLRS